MIGVRRGDGGSMFRTQLDIEIEKAHAAAKKPLDLQQVATIVRDVIGNLKDGSLTTEVKLYAELEELAQTIRRVRQDVVAIQPKDINADYIPRATDELDAVVGATEEASNKIMDVCDEITGLAGNCTPDINQKLVGCTTKIYEACNFQDITGQRITKVVTALKHIDGKVDALLKALGDDIHHEGDKMRGRSIPVLGTEEALLNGPQLAKNAISQDEIDRLLAKK
jgi:chemotaxis protein CheZ